MAEFIAIEMAEWIEHGLEIVADRAPGAVPVRETPCTFLEFIDPAYRAGPLGLALIGKHSDPQTALQHWLPVSNCSLAGRLEAAARLLGISVVLARLIELNHRGGVPAQVIAWNLRAGAMGMAMRGDPVPMRRVRHTGKAVTTHPATAPQNRSAIMIPQGA